MEKFKITAWPVDEEEREYNPTWECIIDAATIGDAQAEGTKLFNEQCSELDHSKYTVHTSTP